MSSAVPQTARPAPSAASAAFGGVFAPLAPHLEELDRFLRAQLQAFEPEIRTMAEYCIDTSGKRIRPALVFFSGWREDGSVSADVVRAAAVIEMVHLAPWCTTTSWTARTCGGTGAPPREPTAPTSAVLLGDALFAHALHLSTQFPTPEVCFAVSESARRVCAGEIIQTLRRGLGRRDPWPTTADHRPQDGRALPRVLLHGRAAFGAGAP